MSPDIPAWQPIDSADEGLPEHVDAALDSFDSTTGCVVLLVAPEIDRRWGADVSLLVARGWAAKGRSVLLADASLEDPVLHESVDGTNDEGVSDVMLYGASVKRVARSVGGGILFAPAGTPVGDAAEVLAHPKWDTVINGFQEAGAVLLLHLSAATTGARALLDQAAGVIVVAEAAEDVSSILDSASDRILAVLGPEVAGEVGADEIAPPVMEPEVDMTSEPEPEFGAPLEAESEPEPEVEIISEMDDDPESELEVEPTMESEPEPEVETPLEAEVVPAGVTEEPAGDAGLFSMEGLPDSTDNAADEVDDSDGFSLEGVAGSQYDASDEAEPEARAPLAGAPEEIEPLEVEPVEVAPPEAEAAEAEAAGVEATEGEVTEGEVTEVEGPATADEAAVEEPGLPAVEGVMGSTIEMDEAAVAAAAEDAHLDMEGFETGAGFELEDAPDSLESGVVDEDAAAGFEAGPGAEQVGEAEGSDDLGFGDGDLEVEASLLAEDDLPDDEELAAAEALSGAAGDLAFDVPDAGSPEPVAPLATSDAPPGDPSVGAGESIAVDAVVEAMAAGTDAFPEDTAGETAVDLEEGPPRKMSGLEELDRRRRRGARVRQLLVGMATALIVGGGGIMAAYFGFINIPGVTPAERVRSGVLPPVQLPGPTPETPVISHVLMVDAWRSMETASSTVDALRGRLPELLFFVTVIEVAGADQYALLAGPAFSAVEADALKQPLAQVLDRLNPAMWTVQEARYSFFFDEYAEAVDAAGRVQSLAALSIPAHVLEVSYPDETTGLRVYGGAFVDEFQAVAMGRLLRANDLGDVRLTERRGRLPQ